MVAETFDHGLVDETVVTFEAYVHARGPGLVRLARLICDDRHRAEDLVQDVLAKAYARWSRIASVDSPDEYVRRMLVNANRSWWRRPAARRETPTAEPVDLAMSGRPDADPVERDAMWRLLTSLPHRQRCVLVLRYYEDLDDASIARILGCSNVTVRTHAMRALGTLRGRLSDTPKGAEQ